MLHNDVYFPPKNPEISSNCKSLVRKLLIKDEDRRLGSKSGASDVKQHAFFKGLNWALLRNTTPPIIPKTSDLMDTSNFRNLNDSIDLDLDAEVPIFSNHVSRSTTMTSIAEDDGGDSNPFEGFDSSKSLLISSYFASLDG